MRELETYRYLSTQEVAVYFKALREFFFVTDEIEEGYLTMFIYDLECLARDRYVGTLEWMQ